MKIHKYTFGLGKIQLHLPVGARFLSVTLSQGHLAMFWLVDRNKPSEPVIVKTYATNDEIPQDPGMYLGSVSDTHVFQET